LRARTIAGGGVEWTRRRAAAAQAPPRGRAAGPGARTITFGSTGSFRRTATNEDISYRYHLTVTG